MQSPVTKPTLALQSSLALALLGSVLFDGIAWGTNVPVFVLAAVLVLAVVRTAAGEPLTRRELAVAAACLAWSGALAFRDSATLGVVAVLALAVTLYLVYLHAACGGLVEIPLGSAAGTLSAAGHHLLGGPLKLARDDVDWRDTCDRGQVARLGQVGRGLLLAAPLTVVFGLLLVSADARFEVVVVRALDWDLGAATRAVAAFVASFWAGAALLRAGVLGRGIERREASGWTPRCSGLEVATVLLVLDLLFAAYVAVQFTYFFGGEAIVRETDSLTYAAYARRGFFELVAVAALVIPLLLLADGLTADAAPGTRRTCRVLAAALVAMVALIELSAAHRMALYARAYGLTELRFYTSAFMVWLLALLGWLAATVLRGRRARFVLGAALAGLALAGLLVGINPDARIARANMARAAKGAPGTALDVSYLLSLSDDAVPTIAALAPTLGPEDRRKVTAALAKRLGHRAATGWRGWNLSRFRAGAVAAEHLGARGR